jgi:hypothetical protein
LGNLWTPATPNSGDPIVLYDKAADRWFLAQFGTTGNKMYIAISTTGDPTGTYYTYTFTSPAFPDYLKFSTWIDGYYMTSNQAQKVFCFDRTAMLAGNAGSRAVYTSFSPPQGSGFFCPLPGDASDGVLPPMGTPCPIFSYSDNAWGAGYSDAVNIYQMAVDWTPVTPTAAITLAANVPTAAFDASYDPSWNDVSQPGTTQKLDGIGGVCMYRSQWKTWNGYNTIVLNWGVKINTTQRSIKWCELRQNQTTNAWSLYQEGIYTPDAATRWMGSIAMDNNGSIGLCYMKSDATSIYPGLYYTGRRACDPLGTMPITETTVVTGTGAQTTSNRVGDYSHLALDPDGITFWHTSEYMGGSTGGSAARTQIFSFQMPVCDNTALVSIAQTSGTNPQCQGSSATFTATPVNGGATPVYQWQVNGANVGTNSDTYTTSSLTNGQIVTCIMTSSISGVLGNPATSNAITMTVNPFVTPSVSIAITTGNNPSCSGSTVIFTASPTNGGTSPSYQWKVDGVNVGSGGPTYSTTSLTNGQIVSCVMTSNANCLSVSTATSNNITMSVTTLVNPTVTIAQTAGSNPICSGALATFTATVTNAVSPVYQWKVDGVNVGTNANSYSTTSLTNGQVVSCVVTSTSNCASVNSNTLGSGTSTNATTSDIGAAYPTYYGNGRQQYLVRASELSALGFSSGNITSLGFSITGNAGDPVTMNGYTIKMAMTASTTTTTTFLAPVFTTVFGPVNYTPTLNAVNTHNFITPFAWDGISNVLIDICFSNQVVGNAAYQNYQTTSSFVSTTYYQADGATGAGACSQTTGSTGSVRPNIIFTIGSSNINTTSNSIAMTVNASGTPSVSIAQTGGTNPSCINDALTFTATPTNGGTVPSYQWNIDGVNAGTNSPTFTGSSFTNGQVVTCIMTSNSPCVSPASATSNGITLLINSSVTPSVSIVQTSGSNPQCAGASATFTATPTNGGTTPSYQWKVDGNNAGTNSAAFTTSSLTDGQIITCIMTSGLTCASPTSSTSNGITMSITASSIVSVSIAQTGGTNPICSGLPATFTATAVNAISPIYQWKVNGVNVGSNSNTYTTSTLTNNQIVSCVVTSASGCSSPISNVLGTGTSTNATNSDLGVAYPTFYGNGRQQYLVRASELTALGFSAGNFTSLGFSNAGTIGSPATLNGYTIKMAMTASTTASSTFLSPAFTTVYGPVNYTPVLNAINTHTFSTPFVWDGVSNVLIDICFSNQVTGTIAYQNYQTTSSFVSTAYYQADGAGGAGACTQATGTTGSIRPNMTFTLGSTNINATSNTITMTVNTSGSPAVTIALTSGTNPACFGTSETFTATPTNGGTTPAYQWLVNGINAGTNSPTFTTSLLTDGQTVSCVMTSNALCMSQPTAISNGIVMTINTSVIPSVSIAQTNGSNPQCPGASVTFTATPANGGAAPSYQWQVNGVNVGTNSSVFTTSSLTNGQIVTCVMTSSLSCAAPATATSNGITMLVNTSSNISVSIVQTGGTNPICAGSPATFTANAVNAANPTYQWKVDGVNAGTNSNTFTTSSLTNGQAVTCNVSATTACQIVNVFTLGTGSGTNTTTAESGVAYPTRYGNGRQHFLLLASELTALGFTAGDITSLGFTVAGTTGNPVTLNGYTIKLATTSVTTLTTTFQTPTPAFTTVFGPINYTPTLNSLNTHTFNNPFTWNGTSNILVDICFSNGAVTGVTAYQTYQTSTAFVSNTYYRSNTNTTPCTRTTATNTASMRPNMRISMNSTGSANASSNSIVMNVNTSITPAVSIALTNGTNPQCTGASATFTATPVNGGTTPTYQWKNGTANVGTNSPTYSTTSLADGDVITCEMTSNASCTTGSPVTSNSITMTINPAVTASVSIAANPGNTICVGASVTFTATPTNGGATPVYQWKNGATNVGTNSPTYTTNSLVNGNQITCEMTSNASCVTGSPSTSNVITMTVNPNLTPSLTITANPGNTICSGTTVTFTAAPTNGGTTPTYQWKNGTSNVGTNSSTYTTTALANGDQITCEMTSNANCAAGNPAISNTIFINVNPALAVSVSVAANPGSTICPGTSVTFTAIPTNGGAAPSYQWKNGATNVGTNSPTYSANNLANGNQITCIMTSNATCATGSPATSNTISMSVNPILAASVSVTANPGNTICSGTSVTFTAIPANGGSTPSYQWKNGATNVGTNSPTYTTNSLANGNQITCEMTSNATCTTGSPATSNVVTMTVNPNITPGVSISTNPGNTICAGSSVTFTAVPVNGGPTPSYTWKIGSTVVGTNSTTFTTSGISSGNVVSCVMTSSAICANPNPVASNSIIMLVNSYVAASVSISANPGSTICNGTPVTFTASPTNGGITPSYQWKNGTTNVGTNSQTYSNASLANGDNITCIMTSGANCASGNPAASNAIIMNVNPNVASSVSISANPGNTICAGTPVTFTAIPANGGTTPSYQWKNGNTLLGTGDAYSSAAFQNGDIITCEMISNANCITGNPAVSNAVTMTVNSIPLISGFTPSSGAPGSTVVISGSGFNGITSITLNGIAVTSYTVDNSSQITITIPANAASGVLSVTTDCGTAISSGSFSVNTSSAVALSVRLFIEGFYTGGGLMTGIISSSVTDTLIIELANSAAPHSILYSQTTTVSITGYATCTFPASVNGNAYYIVVRHRNALETWSAIPLTFTGTQVSYDFTNALNKAYGNNQYDLLDGNFAFWSGDISDATLGVGFQDGVVESQDYSDLENAIVVTLLGYVVEDLTGDGVVESADYGLLESNIYFTVAAIRP